MIASIRILRLSLLAQSCAGLLLLGGMPADAQPAGASVALGSARVSQSGAASTVITQSSEKALINWHSFSVASGANVIFRQPDSSAITLNRVLGSSASAIDGSLTANGKVWLINPNGILFGAGSTIDVGAILATTSDIRDQDFRDGNYNFGIGSANPNAAIVNQGSMHAGSVVLAAPSVSNAGLIEADLGTVVLAGANTFSVDFSGDNLLRFAITSPVSQAPVDADGKPVSALVSNSGTISAPGGKVLLTARAARDVIDNVINTAGMVEATSVSVQNGTIVLDAGPDGTATVSGTLDVSGKGAGETGGAISVLGNAAVVADGAKLDASGDQGGGTILVGGNFHGAGPEQSADTTDVGNAAINADAITKGNGGKVALWSNSATSFSGQISARGGAEGGDGGYVETSGATLAVAPSAQVLASAPNGVAGTWLLDPKFIVIATGGAPYTSTPYTAGTSTYAVSPTSIATALATTNVLLEANTDLTVSNAISAGSTPSGTKLALHAGRTIALNASINVGSGTAELIANDPNAVSDRDAGAGSITQSGNSTILTASVVNLTLSNGSTAGSIGSAGAPIAINAGSLSIKTFGSNAYLSSPSGGVALGTASSGIDLGAGNLSLAASGAISDAHAVNAGQILLSATGDLTISSGGSLTASGSGDAIVLATGGAFSNTAGSGALSDTGSGRWLIFSQDLSKTTNANLTAAPFYNRTFDFTTDTYSAIASTGNRFVYATAPVLTVTANSVSRAYGAANPTFTATITGLIGTDTLAGAVSGAPLLATTATPSSPNPGSNAPITVALGTLTSDYNYGFQFTSGTLSITTGVLTAGLTGTVSKYYDQTNAATLDSGNYTLSGIVSGDSVTLNDPTSGTYDTKNVGNGKTVSVTGLIISGTDAAKYTLSSTATSGAVGVIKKASLVASLTGPVSKPYDGNTDATLATNNYTLSGIYSGDAVTLNDPTSGAYDTKAVGTGKTVSVGGLVISGADSGNYALASPSISGAVGIITQATLTASLVGPVSKVYDSNPTATLVAGNYVLTGKVTGDSVTLNDPTSGTYDNKNVGSGKTVSVTGLAISGADSGNYTLASTGISGAVGVISQATLTASLTGATSKIYDHTKDAALSNGNYLLSGKFTGDTVVLNDPATGTYDTKDVGAGKTVTVTGLSVSGTDAGNYMLASTSISAPIGTIGKASVTAGLTGSVSKVYDGSTDASLVPTNYTLSGVYSGDAATLNDPASGSYDTKNVGTGKTVTVTGLALLGADSGDYVLASTSVSAAIGTITEGNIQVSLTAGLTGTVTKVYDGNKSATLAPENYTLSGVISGDVVALNDPTSGTYDNENVGTGKTVTVTGLAISGTDAGNYTLSSTSASGAIGIITKAPVTVGLTGTVAKVYDSTPAAALSSDNYTVSGLVTGDLAALNFPGAGTYDTKSVGTGKTVTVTGLALLGTDAGNYALASTTVSGAVGVITKAPLIAGLTGTVTKVYDSTNAATLADGNYTLSGVFTGDTVVLNDPTSGTYNNKNVSTGKTVNVAGLAISGADAGNYSLAATVSGAVGTITKAPLTAGLTGTVSKVYNATTAATLSAGNYTLPGVFAGDTVVLNNPVSGTYDNKNVGTGKTVNVTGLALSGTDGGNYALTSTNVSGAVGVITRATLTAALTGSTTKVYDGTTAATLTSGNYAVAGVFAGDAVALNNPASGTYDNKNVGAGKTVSVTGLNISGTDSGNYVLAANSLSAAIGSITPKPLTASLTGTVSKTYDGTTTATLAAGNYALNGLVAGDVVALNDPTAGTYDTKSAGSGKTVNVTGLSISGAGISNYSFSSTTASGAVGVIIPRTAVAGLTGSAVKVYDGTVTAGLSPANYTLSGILPGDVAALNNPTGGSYDTKDVGSGKTVTVAGLGLIGTDGADYVLSSSTVSAAIGAIGKASLTPGLTGTVSKIYDGTVAATLAANNYSLSGILGGDNVSLNDPTTGTYDTPVVGTGKIVTVTGLALTGSAAGDYLLSAASASGPVGAITKPVDNTILTVFLPQVVNPPIATVAPTPDPVVTQAAPVVIVANAGPPAPLVTTGDNGNNGGGNGGETTTASDGVTNSVGQSLDGTRRNTNVTPNTALIGGMLNMQVPQLPTSTPHGVPPADQDFSSWGNQALWL